MRKIFEILGVIYREDSYTDLIKYTFNEMPSFKRKLMALLLEEAGELESWKCFNRISFSDNKTQKTIPDLLLCSKTENKLVLIENKLLSKEGKDQTLRYANPASESAMAERFQLNNPHFIYYYLTLEGLTPTSECFSPIKHSDIVRCLPEQLPNSKLGIVLNEYRELIEEVNACSTPDNEEKVLIYLNLDRPGKLMTHFIPFKLLVKHLHMSQEYYSSTGITANPGSSYIPVVKWSLPHWSGKKATKSELGDGVDCYDIHFEFQWDVKWKKLSFYLHYQTNPYLVKKEYNKYSEWFRESYWAAHTAMHNHLKSEKQTLNDVGWKVNSQYFLQLASCTFPVDITVRELGEKINNLMKEMTITIENGLSSSVTQSVFNGAEEHVIDNVRVIILQANRQRASIHPTINDNILIEVGSDNPIELDSIKAQLVPFLQDWLTKWVYKHKGYRININFEQVGEIITGNQNDIVRQKFLFKIV